MWKFVSLIGSDGIISCDRFVITTIGGAENSVGAVVEITRFYVVFLFFICLAEDQYLSVQFQEDWFEKRCLRNLGVLVCDSMRDDLTVLSDFLESEQSFLRTGG